MKSDDLSSSYSVLFPHYPNARISREPLGRVPPHSGLQLLRVYSHPPPPTDPMPYDLWLLAGGKKIFRTEDVCEAWLWLDVKIGDEDDAVKNAEAIVYLSKVRPYYREDIIGFADGKRRSSAKLDKSVWTVQVATMPYSSRPDFRTATTSATNIRLGTGVCEILVK